MAKTSEPKLEQRGGHPYVGVMVETTIAEMGPKCVKAMDDLFAWVGQNEVPIDGPPFWRYAIINMEGIMHVEVGLTVTRPVAGEGEIKPGVVPEGKYAVMTYTGPWEGDGLYLATRDLLEWGKKNDIVWDRHDVPEGDAWTARLEWYMSDPAVDHDPEKYVTELAFKVMSG